MVDQIDVSNQRIQQTTQPVSSRTGLPNLQPDESRTPLPSDRSPDRLMPQVDSEMVNPPRSRLVRRWQKVGLGNKATLLAITIGVLPVFSVGAIAFTLTDHSLRQQISATRQANAVRLSDQVNRFMLERYDDVQVLAQLPLLTIEKVRESTSSEEKQSVLNKFVEASEIYESVAVLNLNGDAIAQSKGRNVPNQKTEAYFQAVLQSDTPYIESVVANLSRDPVVYLAAPVMDAVSGKTIAIVRTVIPLSRLGEVVQPYLTQGREYNLADSTGKIFVSSRKENLGREAPQTTPSLASLRAAKIASSVVSNNGSGAGDLVSYSPPTTLEGLPPLGWETWLVEDTTTVFAPLYQLLIAIGVGTLFTAAVVGVIAALLAKRMIEPMLVAASRVEKLGQGELDTRLPVQGQDELAMLGFNINQMASQLKLLLDEQTLNAQRSQRLGSVIANLQQAVSFDDVLKTAVRDLRGALQVDRAIVYLFDSTWQGSIVAESVAFGFNSTLNANIADPCFAQNYVEKYRQGRVQAINDIDTAQLDPCYRTQLDLFQIKASIVAPIMVNAQLIGLLVVHQCSVPRSWHNADLDFMRQAAVQVGFVLEQVELFSQREQARQAAAERQHQQQELQTQLLQLLEDIEGAAQGDLTVRADVTAGDIGIVADFFNAIVESLRQIVTQVKQSAVQVNTALNDNEQSIRHLADTSLKQAEETTQTLNAVEQMMSSIQSIADNARRAAAVTRTAFNTAEAGGGAMDLTVRNILGLRETIGETTKKVKRLGESSQQISKVVSLINQIAMQTNLLAINAGIEAARAGEDGQGFAVVAEEVADLATRSATATREIEQIVATIQRETSEVVQAMEQGTTQVVEGTRSVESAKQSLENIVGVSRELDQLVQSISTATVSQVQTSKTITTLMEKIAHISGNTSKSSLEVSHSLRQTVEVAQALQASVGTFKIS
ncbi:methyl-accepting chemotaxis protein [Phormidesmis sp. 146-12]